MPPKPTGQVIERETRDGRVFALCFRAYGERQYLSLGSTADGRRPRGRPTFCVSAVGKCNGDSGGVKM